MLRRGRHRVIRRRPKHRKRRAKKELETMADKLSRRELFNIFRRSAEAVKGPPLPLRPPSAGLEKSIAESCMHCGACVEACPRQAIKPLGPEYGDRAGTPHIVAAEAPCVLCEGLKCTTVCPSGTLKPLRRATEVAMGVAIVARGRCLPWTEEMPCIICHERCPIVGAIRLDEHKRPSVTSACTGCGMCEYYCPTEPAAIRIRPRNATQG